MCELSVNHLERDFAVNLYLTRLIDRSHAAFTDKLQDLVAVAPNAPNELVIVTTSQITSWSGDEKANDT